MKKIDLSNWKRKAQYDFFKDYKNPYFNICSDIKCTASYLKSKGEGNSFFITYMHKALKAINEITQFKTRIIDDEVFEFPIINGTSTIFKDDHTFSFCYFKYHEDFEQFKNDTHKAIQDAKNSDELVSNTDVNLIYVSVIPWRSFTSIQHPVTNQESNSVPKIVFGKVFEQNGEFYMPLSVEAHHSLLDGYHVSTFSNRLEELLCQ